jgi:hypothetical protein
MRGLSRLGFLDTGIGKKLTSQLYKYLETNLYMSNTLVRIKSPSSTRLPVPKSEVKRNER